MVDIQFPTAENRRGKKEEKRKKVGTAAKYNVRICYAERPQIETVSIAESLQKRQHAQNL